jgi:hypothetical protein
MRTGLEGVNREELSEEGGVLTALAAKFVVAIPAPVAVIVVPAAVVITS